MAAAARFSPTLVRCAVYTKPNGPVVVVCCSCGGGVPWRRRPDLAHPREVEADPRETPPPLPGCGSKHPPPAERLLEGVSWSCGWCRWVRGSPRLSLGRNIVLGVPLDSGGVATAAPRDQ